MQMQSNTTSRRSDDAIERMIMNPRQQQEFEAMQKTVPCSIWKDKQPGMRPGMTRPFELPSFGIAEKIHLGQLPPPGIP